MVVALDCEPSAITIGGFEMQKLWQIVVMANSDAARAERLVAESRMVWSISLDSFELYERRPGELASEVARAA